MPRSPDLGERDEQLVSFHRELVYHAAMLLGLVAELGCARRIEIPENTTAPLPRRRNRALDCDALRVHAASADEALLRAGSI
jgi:hypothetical protein